MQRNLPTILVVDDEELNLAVIEEYLEDVECQAHFVKGGREALNLLLAKPKDFDVILLDRMMPDVDGMAVLQEITVHPLLKHCPVIMQTAMAASSEIMEGMAAGAYYYLTKPFAGEMLLSIVHAALRDRLAYVSLQNELKQHLRQLKLLRSARFFFRTLADARELALFVAQACPQPDAVVMGLSEILVNAIEHGNLAISYDEKSRLNAEGKWEQEIESRLLQGDYKDREAQLEFIKDEAGFHLVVTDEGAGFDWTPYLTMSPERASDNHGRGIAMAVMLGFTKVEYRGRGNEVYLFVTL